MPLFNYFLFARITITIFSIIIIIACLPFFKSFFFVLRINMFVITGNIEQLKNRLITILGINSSSTTVKLVLVIK